MLADVAVLVTPDIVDVRPVLSVRGRRVCPAPRIPDALLNGFGCLVGVDTRRKRRDSEAEYQGNRDGNHEQSGLYMVHPLSNGLLAPARDTC